MEETILDLTETNTRHNISFSDNSHIFGIPFSVREGYDIDMVLPITFHDPKRLDLLGEWIKKTSFLYMFDVHYHYEEIRRLSKCQKN